MCGLEGDLRVGDGRLILYRSLGSKSTGYTNLNVPRPITRALTPEDAHEGYHTHSGLVAWLFAIWPS
jgi:hypothetical protein